SAGSLLIQERTLLRPISHLKKAAIALAGGNFSSYIGKGVTGEVGELMDAFETMRNDLENTSHALTETVAQAKESETKQRAIVENISDAIITINEHGEIETFNPGAEAMFGHKHTEIIGNPLDPLIPEALLKKHTEMMNHHNKPVRTKIDTHGQHKDGHIFPIDISVNEMSIGGKRKFTAIIRDISEERASKNALINAKEEAERANEAKTDFLSRMSHELRTPLNAILGFTQVLEMNDNGHLHAEDQLHIKEVYKAGNHLLELVNEVLDLAKIESGSLNLSMEPVNIHDVLEDCHILMRPVATERGISLTCADSPCKEKYVLADRTRMKQVMLNLISNAIKYNQSGGSVNIACEPSDNNFIRLSVKDTGPGISTEHQNEMFKPFNRLWAKNSTIEGTGIGLVITKSFVEKMNGKIGLESTLGTGSTFWFELQQTEIPKHINGLSNITHFNSYNVNKDCRHIILYIEDNPANLRLVTSVLKHEKDIQILTAHEPHLGLEIARIHKPALILLDINLPMIDGYEVLKRLKASAETRDIPVIAVSANAMHSDIKKGISAGFDDYITKPIDVRKLQVTVHGYLINEKSSQLQ
ncbi:MAG: ATP-binding protein, partial [Gammaproteobacteria bacterium]|nr:ATP-binding protein [Gammaproteobacteria bacterium]